MMVVETYLAPSAITGAGVGCFAGRAIKKDEVVWRLTPEIDRLIPASVVEGLPEIARDYVVSRSSFDGKNHLLCYDQVTFINHSLTPNTRVEGDTTVAIKDIQTGEEVTENYHEYDHDGPDRVNGQYSWERHDP